MSNSAALQAELTEAFYLDIKAGADAAAIRRAVFHPRTIAALDAAVARLEAEKRPAAKPHPIPAVDAGRWERVVVAIRTINELHALGDAVYDVRSQYGSEAVDGRPFDGNSWEHPKVQRYGDAVGVLQKEGVIA